ncbi:MAG: hypothetical protein LBG59_06965 [Candidatus Peribacteria bacterium]|jgi:hypothetical protein|nr:hypothetical protein [Candidatus Peribacteria bacterium]
MVKIKKKNKKKKKEQFVYVQFSVIERGAYTDFLVKGIPLFCVGHKGLGIPEYTIAGDEYLKNLTLDKRINLKVLAMRLYKTHHKKHTGIYSYKYYL